MHNDDQTQQMLAALKRAGFNNPNVSEPIPNFRGCTLPPKRRIKVNIGDTLAYAIRYPKEQIRAVEAVQLRIPCAAQIRRTLELQDGDSVDDCIALVESATGKLIWELETPERPPLGRLEESLNAFCCQLASVKLVHADIRPWNLFWDGTKGKLTVIDWGFSFFIGGRKYKNTSDHLSGRGHQGRDEAEIDRKDATRTLHVLKDPAKLESVWNHGAGEFGWKPAAWIS